MLDVLIWETSTEFFGAMFRAVGGWNQTSSTEYDDTLAYCAGGEL